IDLCRGAVPPAGTAKDLEPTEDCQRTIEGCEDCQDGERGKDTHLRENGNLRGGVSAPAGNLPSHWTWPPRPPELGDWPIPWRERWGLLANAYQDTGMAWNEAEARAFAEVLAEREAGVVLDETAPMTTNGSAAVAASSFRWACGNPFCLHKNTGWWMSV